MARMAIGLEPCPQAKDHVAGLVVKLSGSIAQTADQWDLGVELERVGDEIPILDERVERGRGLVVQAGHQLVGEAGIIIVDHGFNAIGLQ